VKLSAPSREALAELASKYETLAELRRARARGEPIPPRSTFKDLADRFPSALHELDVLPLDLIEARAEALRASAATGSSEAWMAWMIGYHALLRAALRVRIRSLKQRDITDERAKDLAADASRHAGVSIDEAFVRAALRPPAGRLANVVYARLEAAFSERASVIRAALFPRHRP